MTLATRAGLTTATWRTVTVAKHPTLLLRRFDRAQQARIPFLSAMSMLGAKDGDPHSYLEIADALRQNGAAARDDMRELWGRMVFSVLISNTDDHLRKSWLPVRRPKWMAGLAALRRQPGSRRRQAPRLDDRDQ